MLRTKPVSYTDSLDMGTREESNMMTRFPPRDSGRMGRTAGATVCVCWGGGAWGENQIRRLVLEMFKMPKDI